MTAKILTLDIERQGALMDDVWEGKQYQNWIGPSRVIEPSRTICMAYRWEHERRTKFISEWDWAPPEDQDNTSPTPGGGHREFFEAVGELLDEADYVVGWNSKNFDVKYLKAGLYAYDLPIPSPWVDLDLMKQAAREFLLPAKSLAYVTKLKGMAGKLKTAPNLRRTLRFSTGEELYKAQDAMRRYNIRDVNQTRAVFHDMRGWVKGMNLGLFIDGDELVCPNCGSNHYHHRGTAKGLSYEYPRLKCQNPKCGKWFKETKSVGKVEVVGI